MLAKLPSSLVLYILLNIMWSEGQDVIDDNVQQQDIISEYCPKREYCAEGTHVMCMYYDKNRPQGPHCANYQQIKINESTQNTILHVFNTARANIALEKETAGPAGGKIKMPRGYAMFRLKWDEELAFYAEVLANQCLVKHDLCRATKKFPNPGQLYGYLNFGIPQWKLEHNLIIKYGGLEQGYTEQKMRIALQRILRKWYKDKSNIKAAMIKSYPEFNDDKIHDAEAYLTMTLGASTHVGCGMAGFSRIFYRNYAGIDDNTVQHNVIQLICNFSKKPQAGQPVYLDAHPGGAEDSKRCGCPEGSIEDDDCLCNQEEIEDFSGLLPCSTDPEQNCEQTVVLLPIFKMENAPKHKLDIKKQALSLTNANFANSKEILQFLQQASKGKNKMARLINKALVTSGFKRGPKRFKKRRKVKYRRDRSDLNIDYSNKYKLTEANSNHNQSVKQMSSVIAKVDQLKLPVPETDVIKKDVEPRKDFSQVEQLVNMYLSKRKDENNKYLNHNGTRDNLNDGFDILYDITTETILNKVEEKVITYDTNINEISNNFTHINFEPDTPKKNNDDDENKLLALLDTLEREVKHIDLVGSQKEMFDAKIRKIYGTVLGKSPSSLARNPNTIHEISPHAEQHNKELRKPSHILNDDRTRHRDVIDENYFDHENNLDLLYDSKKYMHNYNDFPDITNRRSADDINRNHMLGFGDDFNNNDDRFDDLSRAIHKNNDRMDYENDGGQLRFRAHKSHFAYKNENPEDFLSDERIKLYQEKLENLERRLHEARNKQNGEVHPSPQMRRLRPTRDDLSKPSETSKIQVGEVYVPDRARYLYGF